MDLVSVMRCALSAGPRNFLCDLSKNCVGKLQTRSKPAFFEVENTGENEARAGGDMRLQPEGGHERRNQSRAHAAGGIVV